MGMGPPLVDAMNMQAGRTAPDEDISPFKEKFARSFRACAAAPQKCRRRAERDRNDRRVEVSFVAILMLRQAGSGFELQRTATVGRSGRVMKDDAERVSVSIDDLADAVAQLHPIVTTRTVHRPAVDRKDDGVSLGQWHHGSARLHSRALLGQNELAAGEIMQRLGEQHGDLQREDVLAVQILVQAVVVAGTVLQQQWRRPRLAGGGAACDVGKRTFIPIRSCH